MRTLLQKYISIIRYLIFGFITTLINIIVFNYCYRNVGLKNITSNITAWVFAVVFAFLTNKIYVFNSKTLSKKVIAHELITFFLCRLLTGFMDLLIMYISVDVLLFNSLITKIISNIFVIIINYIASHMIIFKVRRENR